MPRSISSLTDDRWRRHSRGRKSIGRESRLCGAPTRETTTPTVGVRIRFATRISRPGVDALALRPEDHDELDRLVDYAEPVRRPSAELDSLTRFDREVVVAEQEP
jgi:hypothetical protein